MYTFEGRFLLAFCAGVACGAVENVIVGDVVDSEVDGFVEDIGDWHWGGRVGTVLYICGGGEGQDQAGKP